MLLYHFCVSVTIVAIATAARGSQHVKPGIRASAENFFEFQTLDHFDRTVYGEWKQRYFVNDAFRRPGGPVFLLLGGQEAANPVWLEDGAMVEYAKVHGAVMVMLEHRYYGNSRPVSNLTVSNLRHLSSKQALADIANFIPDLQFTVNVTKDTKIILFGTGYAGALATWFRSKYPYYVTGAVAIGPPLVANNNFEDYLVKVAEALEMARPNCTAQIKAATSTMYDWYGQPEKRAVMQNIFRLCDKIDHDVEIDFAVFFYALATNFAKVVEYNHVNRTIEGKPDGEFDIDDVCDVMTGTWGTSIERYAKAESLILDQYRLPCLNARFYRMMEDVNQTTWDSYSAEGGRQKLYQICTEFGWNPNSMGMNQPFGQYLVFPLNFTFDQCLGAFGYEPYYTVSQIQDNCDETNRMYGGLDLTATNVVIVNGGIDPWRSVSATLPLKNSPGADIIFIPGTAHLASMYPASERDPPQLTQARARISTIIGKWISMN